MAKNLKLNIKNVQLAKALKIGEIIKKPAPLPEPVPVEEPTPPALSLPPAQTAFEPPPPPSPAPPPVKRAETTQPKAASPTEQPASTPPTPAKEAEGASAKPGFKEYRDFKSLRKAREERSFDARDRQGLRVSEDETWRRRRVYKGAKTTAEEPTIRPKQLTIRLPISIKELAAEMKLKASQLIAKLFMQGIVLTLNDYLEDETIVQLLGHDFGCEIAIDTTQERRVRVTDQTIKQEVQNTPAYDLMLRPPVVTLMGHVDHGKTSLVDAIRKSNLAAGEAGAITQHIGAFRCHTAVGDLTILDTPGHEAFSAMRARGADVTDIAVIVIAGDEGIRTQTLEALEQARAAGVSIVIALSKSDKPDFNAETVYRQLADNNLLPEAWGGATITVNCSAVTNKGVPELLEMLALQAEILELKANPNQRARGTVIESAMDKGLGPVTTVLVQNGTLRIGDAVVFDQYWARIKSMLDSLGREVTEAAPSTPVLLSGLSGLPEAGSEFVVVKDEREAREISEQRRFGIKREGQSQIKRITRESFLQNHTTAKQKVLNLILKGDVHGSVEALKASLLKINATKVDLNILSASVGNVTESDIEMAAASKAVILAFHSKCEAHAHDLMQKLDVTIREHEIIYHAIDDVKEIMKGLLDKVAQEQDTGAALVKTTFKASQLGIIAGCQVTDGTIKRSSHIRVLREGAVIWKGSIASLRRVKEDVKEVTKGLECGILLQNFQDLKEGDQLQAFDIIYQQQELE